VFVSIYEGTSSTTFVTSRHGNRRRSAHATIPTICTNRHYRQLRHLPPKRVVVTTAMTSSHVNSSDAVPVNSPAIKSVSSINGRPSSTMSKTRCRPASAAKLRSTSDKHPKSRYQKICWWPGIVTCSPDHRSTHRQFRRSNDHVNLG